MVKVHFRACPTSGLRYCSMGQSVSAEIKQVDPLTRRGKASKTVEDRSMPPTEVDGINSVLECMGCDGETRRMEVRELQSSHLATPRYKHTSSHSTNLGAENVDHAHLPYGGEVIGSYWRSPTIRFDAMQTDSSVVFDKLEKGSLFTICTEPPSLFFDDFEATKLGSKHTRTKRSNKHSKSASRQQDETEAKTPTLNRQDSSNETTPRSNAPKMKAPLRMDRNQESLAATLLAPEDSPRPTKLFGGWTTGGPTHAHGHGLQEVFRQETGRVSAGFEQQKKTLNFDSNKIEYELAWRKHRQITATRNEQHRERRGQSGQDWAEGMLVSTTRGKQLAYGRTEDGKHQYKDDFVEIQMERAFSYKEFKEQALRAKWNAEINEAARMHTPRGGKPESANSSQSAAKIQVSPRPFQSP